MIGNIEAELLYDELYKISQEKKAVIKEKNYAKASLLKKQQEEIHLKIKELGDGD